MLKDTYYTEPTEVDQLVFEKLVPPDHYLRRVKEVMDFERFRDLVKDCYSAAMGRTAEDPVRINQVGIFAISLQPLGPRSDFRSTGQCGLSVFSGPVVGQSLARAELAVAVSYPPGERAPSGARCPGGESGPGARADA